MTALRFIYALLAAAFAALMFIIATVFTIVFYPIYAITKKRSTGDSGVYGHSYE
jgi:hypothetical protein